MKFVEIVDLEQFLAKTMNATTKFAVISGDYMWAIAVDEENMYVYKTDSPEKILEEYRHYTCPPDEDYEVRKLQNSGFTIFRI